MRLRAILEPLGDQASWEFGSKPVPETASRFLTRVVVSMVHRLPVSFGRLTLVTRMKASLAPPGDHVGACSTYQLPVSFTRPVPVALTTASDGMPCPLKL